MMDDCVPLAVDLNPERLLLQWPVFEVALSAATLRAACRCADCRAAALRGQPVQSAPELRLADLAPVGHYALQLGFSDGHARGIYPWAMLRELGEP